MLHRTELEQVQEPLQEDLPERERMEVLPEVTVAMEAMEEVVVVLGVVQEVVDPVDTRVVSLEPAPVLVALQELEPLAWDLVESKALF